MLISDTSCIYRKHSTSPHTSLHTQGRSLIHIPKDCSGYCLITVAKCISPYLKRGGKSAVTLK